MAGWHGLTVLEGNLSRACQRSVLGRSILTLDWFGMVSGGFHRGNSPFA